MKVGRLAGGGRFLTSVEPMHGTQLAVYVQDENHRRNGDGRSGLGRSDGR